MKKLLIMLGICLLFVAACGKKENTDTSLVGNWTGQIDMTEYVNLQLADLLDDYAQYASIENATIDVELTITKTDINVSFKPESIDNLSAALITAYTPVAEKMLEDTAVANNVSVNDILAEAGITKEEFLQQTVNEPMAQVATDIKNSMQSESSKISGSYFLKDGKITDEQDNAFPYTLDGDTLSITFEDNDSDFVLVLTIN